MDARKAFKSEIAGTTGVMLLAGVALVTFAGCPPEGGPTATELAPGGGPAADDGPDLKPGFWMFAFYFFDDDLGFTGYIETAGIQLNSDGTTDEYFYGGETFSAPSWSQSNGQVQFEHDLFSTFEGDVVNSEYIEGRFSDGEPLYFGVFAAHFIASDLDTDPPAEAPAIWAGKWVMTFYEHTSFREAVTVETAEFESIRQGSMILHADGTTSSSNGNSTPSTTWSQEGDEFRMVYDVVEGPGENVFEARVISPRFLAGTFELLGQSRTGTFIASWVPEEQEIDPDDEGPVIVF